MAGKAGDVVVEPATVDLGGLASTARALWDELPRGAVVWLTGPLGSGKTTFVQALARAAGADAARSPTFGLVHRYRGPDGDIAHVDCYRLTTPDDALDLDLHGLERTARLVLIEWPERAGEFAPLPAAHLRFDYAESPERRVVERLR